MPSRQDLRKRAKSLRLPTKEIADRAHVHQTTVARFFAGEGGLLSTAEKIETVICAEESLLREQLGVTELIK